MVMHRDHDIELHCIVDIIILIELNRESSEESFSLHQIGGRNEL